MSNIEWLRDMAQNDPKALDAWFKAEHETNGIADETNGIHADAPLADMIDELRHYADDLRYYYIPLYDAFEPDERLSELCGEVAEMLERRMDAPEGDAVAILRDWLDYKINRFDAEANAIILNTGADPCELYEIADMVERDYVSRETHSKAADIWQATCCEWEKRCGKLEAERDEALEIRDEACGDAATFKAERDELTDKIGEITDEASELMKKQPYTFDVHDVSSSLRTVGRYIDELTAERDRWRDAAGNAHDMWEKAVTERDELQKELDIANVKLVGKPDCDICDRTTLLEEIEGLTAERDEWKAKAEQAQESYFDAKQDRDAWHERYVTAERAMNAAAGKWAMADAKLREGSSKVRAGSSKSAKRAAAVERLKDARYHTLADYVRAMLGWGHEPHFEDCRDALIDLLTDDDGVAWSNDGVTNFDWLYEHDREAMFDMVACGDKNCCECGMAKYYPDCDLDENSTRREWLMAPHEDAHSKAHSKTEPNLSEQSELLSDANDVFSGESDVTVQPVDANDGNASNQPIGKSVARKTAETPETDASKCDIRDFDDSSEKLEAEIDDWCAEHFNSSFSGKAFNLMLRWLNRQKDITERECLVQSVQGADAILTAENAELQAQNAAIARELGSAMAERDQWRSMCGALMDAADEIRLIADTKMPRGGLDAVKAVGA